MSQARPAQPILVVGPVPPPFHGPAVGTQAMLDHPGLNRRLVLKHLNTSDRRPISNMQHWDLVNVWLGFKHFAGLVASLLYDRPAIVYYPISQNTVAFLRDAFLLAPAILARRRLVIHLHGSSFRRFYQSESWPMRWLMRFILAHTARVIVLGNNLRGLFDGLIAAERVTVVPNGIDRVPFETAQGRARPADSGFQVTYLGNLIEGKGFRYLLEAAPLLRQHALNLRLILAGEVIWPKRHREFEQFVAEQALGSMVSFPGTVAGEAKVRLLQQSDVFVFPPIRPEGQPLVILEAMAAGLPIITTDQGAIAEMVLDGVNGFIVPVKDSVALAEKILLLRSDAALRQKMGAASRERFLRCYTLDRWAEDMAQVFQQVLDEP